MAFSVETILHRETQLLIMVEIALLAAITVEGMLLGTIAHSANRTQEIQEQAGEAEIRKLEMGFLETEAEGIAFLEINNKHNKVLKFSIKIREVIILEMVNSKAIPFQKTRLMETIRIHLEIKMPSPPRTKVKEFLVETTLTPFKIKIKRVSIPIPMEIMEEREAPLLI